MTETERHVTWTLTEKEAWAVARARRILAGGDRVELIPQADGDFKLVRVRHDPQPFKK